MEWTEFLYVIKCNEYYKIGISRRDVIRRIQAIQTSNPYPIRIILCVEIPNAEQVEQDLHLRYERVHHRGEWFVLNKQHLLEIAQVLQGAGGRILEIPEQWLIHETPSQRMARQRQFWNGIAAKRQATREEKRNVLADWLKRTFRLK